MTKMLVFLLLVLGLLLAPAYWIYAKFYTGSQAVLLSLAAITPERDGVRTWKSEDFSLHADMAPVGLVLLAQGSFSPNMDENKPPRDHYTATLIRDGEAAKPLGFSLGVKHVSDSNPVFKEHLLLMHKAQPGNYHIVVSSAAPPDIQIQRMQLQVRQNIHEPDPRIVTTGIILFISGIITLVIS
jgi:hypothetical protein